MYDVRVLSGDYLLEKSFVAVPFKRSDIAEPGYGTFINTATRVSFQFFMRRCKSETGRCGSFRPAWL